jgi:hypothetical protein
VHLVHISLVLSIRAVPKLRPLDEFKSHLRDHLFQNFPTEFYLRLVSLLCIVVEERAEIGPYTVGF